MGLDNYIKTTLAGDSIGVDLSGDSPVLLITPSGGQQIQCPLDANEARALLSNISEAIVFKARDKSLDSIQQFALTKNSGGGIKVNPAPLVP